MTVYELISRKECEDIKRYIHFADKNQLDTKDKFAKVGKLYDIKNKNLQQFNFFQSYYSVDNQMMPYTGKNSRKQTIRTKTIHFGYKNLTMCSDNGYPYFIDPYPYCGSKYSGQNKHLKIFLLALLSILYPRETIGVIRKYSLKIGFPPYRDIRVLNTRA